MSSAYRAPVAKWQNAKDLKSFALIGVSVRVRPGAPMKLTPKLSRVFIHTCNDKYKSKDIKRFISKIKINKDTECWEWIGSLLKSGGYGQLMCCENYKLINHRTHRMSYEIYYGKLITKEMFVCHKCDNHKCVNPDHLFLGTHQDNMNDMVNKGRQSPGLIENNGNAKLTWIKVREIRTLYNEGYTCKKIASITNTSIRCVNNIVNNKSWVDINYSKNRKLKLTTKQIIEVKNLYNTGEYTQQQLAVMYITTRHNIRIALK